MRHKILGLPVILSLLFLALPVQAYEEGQWVYRVGVATVQPIDSASQPAKSLCTLPLAFSSRFRGRT